MRTSLRRPERKRRDGVFLLADIRAHYAETIARLTLRISRLERFRRSISDDPHARVFVNIFWRTGGPRGHKRKTLVGTWHERRAQVLAARRATGWRPSRFIPLQMRAEIWRQLQAGASCNAVARACRVSVHTVYSVRDARLGVAV